MKKTFQHLVFGGLCGAILLAASAANAQPKPATTHTNGAADTTKFKRDWYPFYGTVAAVDATAKTVSLKKKDGERVLQTDAKTTFEQNGKTATLADIKAGNYLHGKLHKNAAGAEVVTDARIELTPPGKAPKEEMTPATPPATDDNGTNKPARKRKTTSG